MTTFPLRAPLTAAAALPVLLAATVMVVLDFFIVNVALPAMQADLGASAAAIEWVVAGYGLAMASTLVIGGRMGDQFGRRRAFVTGLALFTLASGACGLAPSAGLLVGARIVQGLAAALLTPQVLSIIGVVFDGDERVKALTAYGLAMGLAAAGGQLIGGVLVATAGWRWCFLINLPIGAAALLAAPVLVPESRAEGARRLDVPGAALLTVALVAIVLPLIEGRAHGWPAWTWASLAAAPVLLAAFVIHARRAPEPLIDLRLFGVRGFTAGLGAQLAFWCGQAAFFLVFALYHQQGRGLAALQAGAVFTVLAVAYLVASARAPELARRHGRDVPAAGGIALAAGHALMLAAVAHVGVTSSWLWLVPGMLAIGAGMGLCIATLNATVLAEVAPHQAGSAAGVLSTTQQVGNAIGVAITGVLFFGALGQGPAPAFELAAGQLVLVGVAVAALSRLLPGGRA